MRSAQALGKQTFVKPSISFQIFFNFKTKLNIFIAALSLVVSAAVAQQQYRPSAGFGGGSGGFGGGQAGFGAGGGGGDYDDGVASDSGDTGGSLEETIPGIPGDDYPIFAEVPETSFLCDGLVEGGYYADSEAECQVFHICGNDGNGGLTKYSFLCPNGE